MYYGDGLPPSIRLGGKYWNYLAGGLDVVGHELAHGVTDYSPGLIYRDQSGALDEAFSDIGGRNGQGSLLTPAARATLPDASILSHG